MALRFHIGSVPVRVEGTFFITTLLFNVGLAQKDVRLFLAWAAVVFVSVLAHELGHASLGLAFGLEPQIALHGLGGTTSWPGGKNVSWGRRVAISLAGPGAGMATGALVLVLGASGYFPQLTWPTLPSVGDALLGRVEAGTLGEATYLWLLWVNFGWGLLNLVPMMPLDGGNAMTSALHGVMGGKGEGAARIISLVVALLALGASIMALQWWPALLSGWFLSINWRGLRDLRAREHDAPMLEPLQEAHAALQARDGARVVELARPVALKSRTEPVRAQALQLLAFGFLLEGRVEDADAAIAALPRGYAPDPSLLAFREARGSG
jgi:Zn-dependent protease